MPSPTTSDAIFAELTQAASSGGVDAALDRLAELLKSEERYHELFDARLMQGRFRLGLPVILTTTLDELPEPTRTQVEEAYLDACREVGQLLLEKGRVREAWMYLRPVGDKEPVAVALERIQPDEENTEELIDVALHQGVHPKLGFQLVLSTYGTCNAISMFDAQMHDRPLAVRQDVVALLVRHLHDELCESLKAEISRQEGASPNETSIAAMVADRDWLFSNDNYHVDTSHLSATVRFARLADDPDTLRLAVDLTEYGRRLSPQYQFAGEEPFTDAYPSQGMFFRAQLGEEVDAAIEYFRQQAADASIEEQGTGPAEVYVALLARLGRRKEAIDALAELIPPGVQLSGFAPTLGELAKQAGQFDRMMDICRQRGDLLGFTAGLVERHQHGSRG